MHANVKYGTMHEMGALAAAVAREAGLKKKYTSTG
jgi:hypothetical protein